jgi:hypothetical protein
MLALTAFPRAFSRNARVLGNAQGQFKKARKRRSPLMWVTCLSAARGASKTAACYHRG